MAKQKKQKIVNAVKGKPAFYARYELNELRLQLSGPWTIVYQTDCGAIAERPDPTLALGGGLEAGEIAGQGRLGLRRQDAGGIDDAPREGRGRPQAAAR